MNAGNALGPDATARIDKILKVKQTPTLTGVDRRQSDVEKLVPPGRYCGAK